MILYTLKSYLSIYEMSLRKDILLQNHKNLQFAVVTSYNFHQNVKPFSDKKLTLKCIEVTYMVFSL